MTDQRKSLADLYALLDSIAGIDDSAVEINDYDDVEPVPLSPGFIERCLAYIRTQEAHRRFRSRQVSDSRRDPGSQ